MLSSIYRIKFANFMNSVGSRALLYRPSICSFQLPASSFVGVVLLRIHSRRLVQNCVESHLELPVVQSPLEWQGSAMIKLPSWVTYTNLGILTTYLPGYLTCLSCHLRTKRWRHCMPQGWIEFFLCFILCIEKLQPTRHMQKKRKSVLISYFSTAN